MEEREVVLDVQHLCKYYSLKGKKTLKAVDDVSFQIFRGETLGIVGESGCGKTTTGKTCIGMLGKTGGDVFYCGKNVHELKGKEKFNFARKVQMVFQDPYASLDPHQKVYDIVAEGVKLHKLAKNKEEERQMVIDLLKMVGLNEEHAMRNVHEFSGGQRQRIGIARALSVDPEFLFCDEPISALDVSIQGQIVNLLVNLQKAKGLTLLFIAHDIGMVRHVSDRVGVMYLGNMVELCESEDLYDKAAHPYTQALLSAIPAPDPDHKQEREKLEGDVPSPVDLPPGCVFAGRCKYCTERCRQEKPALKKIEEGHFVACHHVNEK